MARRRYDQFCALAQALDVIGERWTLLIVRELLLGPKRFTDLQSGLPGIPTNLLIQRLRQLEDAGVLERGVLPPPAASAVYQLTEHGRGLEPAIVALVRWSVAAMQPPAPGQALRAEWLLLLMRATFRPDPARGARATYELRIDAEAFQLRVDGAALAIERGPATHPDLVLTTAAPDLVALIMGGLTPEQAITGGRLRLEGPRQALDGYLALFRYPDSRR
ncbi:MAG TPA: winged helix-turn-helix transcriptional regulator [Actinomycetes bacterium]|nr:winged helix-turn-helix transcriptional regulator [Actinomycetes bacterium]